MFTRVVCITVRPNEFKHFPSKCWAKSGRFRWTFLRPDGPIDGATLREAKYIIVDWPVQNIKAPQPLWERIRGDEGITKKILHSSEDPKFQIFGLPTDARRVERKHLEGEIQQWLAETISSRPTIEGWDKNPFLDEIDFLKEQMPLIVEKYFPEVSDGQVWVISVSGGRSGTPIIRCVIPGHSNTYGFKFFQKIEDFKQEWNAHAEASRWLGDAGIPLQPVPEVAQEGIQEAHTQAEVFNYEGAKVFPVCYSWADSTDHLEKLYRMSTFSSERSAYQAVLLTFGNNQQMKKKSIAPLNFPFVGPLVEERNSPETCSQALRSSPYQRWFDSARDEFKQMGVKLVGDPVKWGEGIRAIERILGTKPPEWLQVPVQEVCCGSIHGDPNARNILFNAHASGPLSPRFIDLGRFKTDVPLVVDLMFMEADIKFALLATEDTDENEGGYLDWDTEKLAIWRAAEEETISRGLDYAPSATDFSDPSVARAYTIIGDIRQRAKEVSPKDPHGRAYFFYLLFWSLRQIRSWSLPPTKRLFALYSASRICQRFMKWPNI